ncbi:MAG: hypothetical protein WDN50_02425 [Bradyrhizobium sp.]
MPRVLLAPFVAVAVEQLIQHLPEGGGVQLGGASGQALGVAVGQRIDPVRQQPAGFVALVRASARLTTRAEPIP